MEVIQKIIRSYLPKSLPFPFIEMPTPNESCLSNGASHALS